MREKLTVVDLLLRGDVTPRRFDVTDPGEYESVPAPLPILLDVELTPTERIVYLGISYLAGPEFRMGILYSILGISRATAARAIRRLVERGFVRRTYEKRGTKVDLRVRIPEDHRIAPAHSLARREIIEEATRRFRAEGYNV
jgi:DNA-binding MarR family transcriptional regulator